MDRLMRMDPGLERRFQGKLHLPDYTCEQLASICEQVASTRFGKTFEPGLHALLGRHINAFFWREIATQNGGLAVNLTERALERQADRLVGGDAGGGKGESG